MDFKQSILDYHWNKIKKKKYNKKDQKITATDYLVDGVRVAQNAQIKQNYQSKENIFKNIFDTNMWKQAWIKRKRRKSLQNRSKKRYLKRNSNKINLPFNLNTAKLFKYGAIAAFVGIVLITLVIGALFAWYAKDLPRPDKIVRKNGFATKIYDRNDKLLYEVFVDEKRIPVDISQISKDLINATIATEDKNFYQHEGFDPLGYLRIVYNVMFKGRVIGGSTLTQQIVKNVLLSSERTITRKMKELVLAIQIEKRYSKEDILRIYLNEAPYGGTAWGVAAASEMYFGKTPIELTLLESAILAGMPQSPSYYSPYGSNPDAFKGRTKDVLRRMREDGYITKDQEKESIEQLEDIKFKPQGGNILAPHFVMYVKSVLEQRYGESLVQQGGLNIKTSLDYELHKQIQDIVTEEIDKVSDAYHITNGATVVMNPQTGEILSMVGSRDYFANDYDGNVNVTTSLRQPGSSIKPVTYLTALKQGFTPESVIMDVKTEFPGVSASKPYVPKNYNGKFVGPVTLRTALASSLNIPAVKVLALVGVKNMMQNAYDMGIESFKPTKEEVNRVGLSVTLGGGETTLLDLTKSYSAFANQGHKVEPISILKVTDRNGKILEETEPEKGKQVMSPEEAFLISNMLSDNNARQLTFGPNSLLNIPWRTIAVKTGTTDDQRDNWAIGWNPQIIVGVWVGNNDNSKMNQVASGVSGASPIWRRSILTALEGKPVIEFEMPKGIESIALDKISGYPAHDDFESKESLIIKGTQPTGKDPIHVKLKVCKDHEDKLAPEPIIAKNEYIEKEFFIFKEDDPLFGNDNNHWQKGIDEWVASQSDDRYKYPTEYCEASDDIVVVFKDPEDKQKLGNKFDIKVNVGTIGDISKVEFFAGDKKLGERKHKPYKIVADLEDGVYVLKAKAYRKDGKTGERTIQIGVNRDWDWKEEPDPTPTPTPTPSPTSTPTVDPSASPTPTPTP